MHRFRRAQAAALATALLAGCASAPSTAAPLVRPVAASETPLGPGDTFEVAVYGEADLSGKYRVADDGTINFPLIGRMEIEGLSSASVAERIRAGLVERKILRAPSVSVTVTEQVSKRFTVLGAVAKPGGYAYVPGTTAVQAISVAGGLTAIARGDSVVLTRRVKGALRRFNVPVDSITEGRADDVPIEPGDILFVPERVF